MKVAISRCVAQVPRRREFDRVVPEHRCAWAARRGRFCRIHDNQQQRARTNEARRASLEVHQQRMDGAGFE